MQIQHVLNVRQVHIKGLMVEHHVVPVQVERNIVLREQAVVRQ